MNAGRTGFTVRFWVRYYREADQLQRVVVGLIVARGSRAAFHPLTGQVVVAIPFNAAARWP